MKKLIIKRALFLLLFLLGSIYILFIKSELFYSYANVVIKDLSSKTASFGGFSFLLPSNASSQDAYVLQTYLESFDELNKLDKNFNLKKHYMSEEVDILDRLKPWDKKEDFLKLYNKRLQIIYDDATGIIKIGFLHTNPDISFKIVQTLIKDANEQINKYNKLVAQKQLNFIKEQLEKSKKALDKSVKNLEDFQNKHLLIDPTKTAESQFSLLANLEAALVEKQSKLNELSQYMNEKSFEIISLKNEIKELKRTISKIKKELANPDKKALNIYIFEFERLKRIVDFNTELYKQILLQYEQAKVEVNKQSKMLLELTKPYMPEGYTYPEKAKDILTLFIVLLMLYGIVSLIESIIKEHFD
jgi:capsular polysaccharide transport system permease protein